MAGVYFTIKGGDAVGLITKKSWHAFDLDEIRSVPLDDGMIPMQFSSSSKNGRAIPPKSLLPYLNVSSERQSNQGDVVLDPFCGSGTTLRAAKTLGRKYIGIDQNPEAVRISENRLNPPQQELFTA